MGCKLKVNISKTFAMFDRRNTPESYLDELRSLVATYMFRHVMEDWAMQGVDFKHHLYVPETDKITGVVHHERADHCHLLKRIASEYFKVTLGNVHMMKWQGLSLTWYLT